MSDMALAPGAPAVGRRDAAKHGERPRSLPAAPGLADAVTEVTVGELQRAWRAIRAGGFADAARPVVWRAAEPVLVVLGAHGQSGASTLALALASAAAPARVVECASAASSGLVAASTAELGASEDGGWLRGTRGEVLIERNAVPAVGPVDVPRPLAADRPLSLTVVDLGWAPAHLLSVPSWLCGLVLGARCVVVTATATVPGLRRLETTLTLLPGQVCVAAVLGPPVRRWPKQVAASAGPLTRDLIAAQRVVGVPELAAVRVAGVTPEPLSRALLAAAEEVLRAAGEPVPTPDLEDES